MRKAPLFFPGCAEGPTLAAAVEPTIRRNRPEDLAPVVELYNHYITDTHVSFDDVAFDPEDRRDWYAKYRPTGRYQMFLAEEGDRLVGVIYSSPYRPKPGYDTSVELTLVLDPGSTGKGLGARLLRHLLDALAEADVHRAYAIVALPNDPAVGLLLGHGFRSVGVESEVGRKFGRYWSTELFELSMG